MIEIITCPVNMPPYFKRRYQKNLLPVKKNKWVCIDTETGQTIITGSFEKVSLACHNLNKKHYLP